MPVESAMLRRTTECRWPLVGKDVEYTGYSVLYGISRYTTKMAVPQLVSGYMSEATGVNPGEEFALSCYERNWTRVFRRAWAGGPGETNKDSMFLSLGYVFVWEHMIKE